MPKISLERNDAAGCQSAAVNVKKKRCTASSCLFGQPEGAAAAQHTQSPARCPTAHQWVRSKGSRRAADASAQRFVRQHRGGTGERRAHPPWQPSPATVDNQRGFGFVNIIEMFQGCSVFPCVSWFPSQVSMWSLFAQWRRLVSPVCEQLV